MKRACDYMLKQLNSTIKGALIASLILQISSTYAFSQGRKSVAKTSARTSSVRTNVRPSSKLIFKPNMSRAMKVAHYKRAETLSQTASMNVKETTEDKIVTGSVNLAHSQSLIDHQDGTRQNARTIIMGVNTKINSDWAVLTRVSFQDDPRAVDSIENGFSDLMFRLGKSPIKLFEWLKGSYSYTAVLPTSKYSTQFQGLQTSLGANYSLELTPAVLTKGFELSLTFTAGRNFHQYETDKSGRVLNEYSLRETLSGAYSYKSFTFSTDLMLRHGFSYNGETSQAFEHSQEIGYSITPRWGVSLGHTNSGSWFRPNGQDSNLKLIDENNSVIYGSTSLKF